MSKREITVWKVVKRNRSSSCMTGELARKYEKGITTKPIDPRFPLYAFTTKDFAREFIKDLGKRRQIIECKAVKSRSKTNEIVNGIMNQKNLSLEDIKRKLEEGDTFNIHDIYRGTVSCSSITPLE